MPSSAKISPKSVIQQDSSGSNRPEIVQTLKVLGIFGIGVESGSASSVACTLTPKGASGHRLDFLISKYLSLSNLQ